MDGKRGQDGVSYLGDQMDEGKLVGIIMVTAKKEEGKRETAKERGRER